jgi:hypothetical protein
MINVRLQSEQGESMRDATFLNARLTGHFPFARENLAPILRYPYEMIGDLVVGSACFISLQGIACSVIIPIWSGFVSPHSKAFVNGNLP